VHRLLERQVRRCFGTTGPPEGLEAFLAAVDASYRAADEDRGLLERSLDLTSVEMTALNEDLRLKIGELERVADALRSSEARYRLIVETATEGIWILDADDRTSFVNERMCTMLGYTREEMAGRPLQAFVDGDNEAVAARMAGGRAGIQEQEDLRFRRKDGRDLWAIVSSSPLFTDAGDDDGVLAMITDITDRRQAGERLREAYARLTEVDRFRGRFLNMAAHELGTPLTPIILQIQVMRQRFSGVMDEGQRRSLDLLDRNIERLALLVKDLLDSARLQTGHLRMDPRWCDVRGLVLDAVESLEAPAEQAGLALVAEAELTMSVRCDPDRIHQVLDNLLHNAIKFTRPGGQIHVRAFRSGRDAVIEVRDTGIGIESRLLERLFQPFSQVHGEHAPGQTGTGLGLYICRGIVERSGGRIACHSAGLGQGATFSVVLPLAGTEGGADAQAEGKARDATRPGRPAGRPTTDRGSAGGVAPRPGAYA